MSRKQTEEERRAYQRDRYKSLSQAAKVLYRAQGRAQRKKLAFDLDESDTQVPEFCPVLPWIKLEPNNKKFGSPFSPSIDRIDPEKGYVKGNVRVISWRANKLKADASIEEMERILAYMKEKA